MDAAARLAHYILSHETVEEHAAEGLERLLSRIRNEKLMAKLGQISGEPISFFLRGDEIADGFAPSNLVDRFTSPVLNMFRRMAACLSDLPYTARPPASISEKYRMWQSQPLTGSYRVDFCISGPVQLSLDLDPSAVQPDDVVSATMEFIQNATSLSETNNSRINDLVPNPEYRTTLLRLVRNMIPDGKGVNELELRRTNEDQEKAVYLIPESRQTVGKLITPVSERTKIKEDRVEPEEVIGTLRAVDLDTRRFRVDGHENQRTTLTLPATFSDDVITPMLNRNVKIQRRRRSATSRWIINDIDFAD